MGKLVVRAPMPPSRRAKQFAPFDALKGLSEAIAQKEKIPVPRRILAEDAIAEINRQLSELEMGSTITVIYYSEYGQEYCQLTGEVVKVDGFWKLLQIGNMAIDFYEIAGIEIVQPAPA